MNTNTSPEASLLSKIFQDASLPIIIEDLDGRVTAMNPAAVAAYGWSNEELLGLPIKTLVPPERHYQADELLSRCKSGEIVRDIESVRVAKNGTRIPVLLTLSLLKNTPESELSIASMATDITSLKTAENELRAYHDKLEAMVQERTSELESTLKQLALARGIADRANNAKSHFLANIGHEIRTPMNAIIGMTHLCLQTDLNKRQRGFLTKANDSSRALLRLVNDILDYSKIEAQKLELEIREFDLDQLLERQASLLAHSAWEKGLSLLFVCYSDVPRLLLGDSLRIGQILTNLLSNAIKFTDRGEVRLEVEARRLKSGIYRYEFSVFDSGIGIAPDKIGELFESFQQADTSITRRYGGSGLGLAICKQLASLMNGDVGVDSKVGRGSRFWFTLELEAFEDRRHKSLSSEGTALLLRCSELSLTILRDYLTACSWSWVEEEDSGELPGCSLVFVEGECFNQSDDIERLRTYCRQHPEAKIVVLSQGTSTEIADSDGQLQYLPYPMILRNFREFVSELFEEKFGDQTPDFNDDPGSKPYSGIRVLVVEDHPINREVLREFLQSVGVQVTEAVNGKSACEIALQESFDLVLMDVQMPVMDGMAATRLLRESGFEKPIIAVTANVSAVEQQRYLSAGMDAFLSKPIEPQHLFDSLASFTFDKGILDYDFGLESLRGNTDLYHRMMVAFLEEMGTLRERYESASGAVRRRLAHSLVGVSGNLGLHDVSAKAKELELKPSDQLLDELLGCIRKVRQSYKRQERRGNQHPSIVRERVTVSLEFLHQLDALLRIGDAQALSLAASLTPPENLDNWDEFLSLVEDFEFDRAGLLLTHWLRELGESKANEMK